MIKASGNILLAKENRRRRQSGHLRLIVSGAHQVGIQPTDKSAILQREGGALTTTVTSESVMPKRQHDLNYKDGESAGAGSSSLVAHAEDSGAPTIKREFMLTSSADECLYDAIRALSKATGTTLSNSHFLRIVLKVIANALPEIEREASRLGKLKRPGNARVNQAEREEFERVVASAIDAAFRSSPPLALTNGPAKKGKPTA